MCVYSSTIQKQKTSPERANARRRLSGKHWWTWPEKGAGRTSRGPRPRSKNATHRHLQGTPPSFPWRIRAVEAGRGCWNRSTGGRRSRPGILVAPFLRIHTSCSGVWWSHQLWTAYCRRKNNPSRRWKREHLGKGVGTRRARLPAGEASIERVAPSRRNPITITHRRKHMINKISSVVFWYQR